MVTKPKGPPPVKEKPHTRCCECGIEFTTRAAEDRHVEETKHARYELVLT